MARGSDLGGRGLWRELEKYAGHRGAEHISYIIKALIQESLVEHNRQSITVDDIATLHSFTFPLPCEPLLPHSCETLTDTFKLLRNLSVGVAKNQEIILDSGAVSTATELLSAHIAPWLQEAVHREDELHTSVMLLAKTCLQFLGNLCVGFDLGQNAVWELLFPRVLQSLTSLCNGHDDIIDLSSMVIHMCTHSSPQRRNQLLSCKAGRDIVTNVLSFTATGGQLEWSMIVLDSLLTSVPLRSLCDSVGDNTRLKLHLLKYTLTRLHSGEADDRSFDINRILNEENLLFLGDTLRSQASSLDHTVFHRVTGREVDTSLYGTLQTHVMVTMTNLKLLCQFTQYERWLLSAQRHHSALDLLRSCVALLKHLAIYDGSDTSGRHRSRLQSVSPSGEEKEHLLFGFKRDLVRLIANLCYRNLQAQDEVREMEAIPLILNQCNIDHYNPYITQWAVFAVHNLCEDNVANQKVIAGLEGRGVAERESLLEFGCEVEVGDDGKIRVKPQQ